MSLHVNASGRPDAPAIVFLHGAGVSSWMWTEQVSALGASFHCLTVDLPGNGESHAVPWRSLADSADKVADVIRSCASGGKAHVVGLSLGGYTALTLLQRHPDLVESLIVSGVTARPFENQRRWALMLGVLSRLIHFRPFVALNARMMQLPPDAAAAMRRDMLRMRPETLRAIYHELLPFSLPASLAGRPHRVLAVAGEHEQAAIVRDLAAFHEALPNATTAIAPGAHHGWNGEYPELFTAMVETWVRDGVLADRMRELRPSA